MGQEWGWRGVFVLSAGAAVLAFIIQAATLPRVPAAHGGGFRALGVLPRDVVIG